MWSYSRCLLFHAEESEVPLWRLFLKKIAITYVSTYRNTSETSSGDCSPFLRYHVLSSEGFFWLELTDCCIRLFESTISGHVCTAWIETSWPSPDRSWTCLFGMNTMYDHWWSSKSPPTSAQTKRLLNKVVISARLSPKPIKATHRAKCKETA